jgi:hypothetical protein
MHDMTYAGRKEARKACHGTRKGLGAPTNGEIFDNQLGE